MTRHHERSPDALLARLLGPAAPEVTCERCFEEIDRYVDAQVAGMDAELLVPGMRAHLEGCSACREEHQSLRALVEAEHSLSRRST